MLLEEILEADADVIALQEVNHYGVRCDCASKLPPPPDVANSAQHTRRLQQLVASAVIAF